MIDFAIPQDIKDIRARVGAFIDAHVLPAEAEIGTRPYFSIVADLQAKARTAGLWCPFIPAEWGGMGLGHLANAVVQVEVGRSPLAAWAMNCMGPQDATMLTLLEHGTQEQKERFLVPLVSGERRICFSMTERAAGSDATGMRTTAVRDGEDWILNGEKWFSSSASISNYALVMAQTDPDAPRHRQFTARYALERETFGQALADRQGIQWMLADCARDLYIARLMVLHIAYKMEHGLDIGQENSIAKNFIADMLSSVVDTALQIHGALGYTLDTPLAAWYAEVRMQHLVDGPDEVHRWRIGRHVLAAQRKSGTTAAAAGGDLF